MSRFAADAATVSVIWIRDLMLFGRQRSRVLGAVATTLLLWVAVGAGFAPSFAPQSGDVGYLEYFFPGVVLMMLLQVSIGATMSVIEDRSSGFLQGVLVAPGSRAALVLGKTLGGTTVALAHVALLLTLAPLAGYGYTAIAWVQLLAAAALAGLALTGLGFAIAWILDSIQGYHIVMNLVLFPLWILSGAMYPAEGLHPVLASIVRFNPLSYAVAALRRALYGGATPAGAGPGVGGQALEWSVLVGAALAMIVLASRAARRGTDRG